MTDEDSLSVVFYVHTNQHATLQDICRSFQQLGERVQPNLKDQRMVRVMHSVPCTVNSMIIQVPKHHCSLAGVRWDPQQILALQGVLAADLFCMYCQFKAGSFHIAAAASE